MFSKTAIVATIAVATQAIDIQSTSFAPVTEMKEVGKGCCRFSGWRARGQGMKTIQECKMLCKNDSTCVAADISDERNGKHECFLFQGNASGLSKASLGCGRKQSDVCYKKQAAAKPAPVETADFSDDSFLGGLDSFKEAEARRAVYLAEHMKLVAARYAKAHLYFKAKDIAAEKVRIEGEWNTAWLAAVKKHDEAQETHEGAKKATIDANTKKRNAIHAQLQASEATTKALAIKEHALADWNAKKLALNAAEVADNDAENAENSAIAEHKRTNMALAVAEGNEKAAKKVSEKSDADHNGAIATEAQANEQAKKATKAHADAVKEQEAADNAERVAARARSAAHQSHVAAQEATTLAIKEKAAALARARFASNAVRTHMKANWMYAL